MPPRTEFAVGIGKTRVSPIYFGCRTAEPDCFVGTTVDDWWPPEHEANNKEAQATTLAYIKLFTAVPF
jgi:hypothetical protein